jgi:hypothetical protein
MDTNFPTRGYRIANLIRFSFGFEDREITYIRNAGTQFQEYDIKPGRSKSEIFLPFSFAF